MDADFSIELGPEDPVLDFPWTDPAGKFAYVDLKRHPELLLEVEEAAEYPELGEFLRMVNSARSVVETAKCDAWATTELNAEEEIFGASHKFGSYVDAVISDVDTRRLPFEELLSRHERFARKLVELLRRAPEIPSAVEVCVRRCYYANDGRPHEGLYFTVYVSGYGDDGDLARQNWGIGLKLVGNAVLQVSAGGRGE